MTAFLTVLHILVCIFLAIIILMQSGRGGGLTEHFASAESILGAKTNSFLVKATTIIAIFFLLSCLVLAFNSVKKNESLMPNTLSIPIDKKITLPMPSSEESPEPMAPMVAPAVTTNAVTPTP